MKLEFRLNGKHTIIDTPSDRRVIDLLREDLGLTGTKEACGAGDCGACTILVDGESRLACLMLAVQLEGRDITTIEGLSGGSEPHRVQDAFIEHAAVQCGFCIPGMILATVDLLERESIPSRAAIRQGLAGNLCRCGGYQKILDAVEAVAAKRAGQENE